MTVRILSDANDWCAVLFCDRTRKVFGPVIEAVGSLTAGGVAGRFLGSLPCSTLASPNYAEGLRFLYRGFAVKLRAELPEETIPRGPSRPAIRAAKYLRETGWIREGLSAVEVARVIDAKTKIGPLLAACNRVLESPGTTKFPTGEKLDKVVPENTVEEPLIGVPLCIAYDWWSHALKAAVAEAEGVGGTGR